MFCEACGTQLQAGQQFCSTCGKLVSPAPFAEPRGGRVRQHLQLLGIFWLILSALHSLAGLLVIAVANAILMAARHGPFVVPPIVRPLFAIIVLLILGKGLLGVAAGIGLLKRSPWARSLALLLAFLSLLEIPFGTVLAIYTIWVLNSSAADLEYRTLASGA